jgi:chemotaxis protein MotB
MNGMKKSLEEEIQKGGYADKVKVALSDEGLDISMQDVVLFNSGDADVIPAVYPLLKQISSILNNLDNSIKVAGYTDNVPIKNSKFRSNWDLSAMRAINVMNFMVDTGGLNSKNVSIQAYGERMPKFDNTTEEGRAKNRRVEIIIIRKYAK